jgi:hypothetical protein
MGGTAYASPPDAALEQATVEAQEPRAQRVRRAGRIPVLLIAGAPRSGSTLLERLVGMREGFFSTGEVQFIWRGPFGLNQLCGCGIPFHDCEFWLEVSRRAFGVPPDEFDWEHAASLKKYVERRSHIPTLAVNRPLGYRAELTESRDLLKRLYGAMLDVSGARVIVDSSKDPRHGLVLARSGDFDVHVVHLIRDPRAVAYSWQRKRQRPEIYWKSEDMMVKSVGASGAEWSTHNAVAELLTLAASSRCRVRYEDFVSDPDATLARVLAPHEGAGSTNGSVVGTDVELAPTHSVSGNPMRFKSGHFTIKLDDEWRAAMSRRSRLSVAAATWPLLARYGYRLRG